jgi:hypothetical protein
LPGRTPTRPASRTNGPAAGMLVVTPGPVRNLPNRRHLSSWRTSRPETLAARLMSLIRFVEQGFENGRQLDRVDRLDVESGRRLHRNHGRLHELLLRLRTSSGARPPTPRGSIAECRRNRSFVAPSSPCSQAYPETSAVRPAIRRRHARVPVAARNTPQDLVERGNPGKARLRLPGNWRGVAGTSTRLPVFEECSIRSMMACILTASECGSETCSGRDVAGVSARGHSRRYQSQNRAVLHCGGI